MRSIVADSMTLGRVRLLSLVGRLPLPARPAHQGSMVLRELYVLQVAPLSVKAVGAASLLVQVPWKPFERQTMSATQSSLSS